MPANVQPSRHRQALLVWVAVLPTLTVLQLVLSRFLEAVPPYLRPPIMATVAVPVVVYVLMPMLLRLFATRTAEPAGRASSRRG